VPLNNRVRYVYTANESRPIDTPRRPSRLRSPAALSLAREGGEHSSRHAERFSESPYATLASLASRTPLRGGGAKEGKLRTHPLLRARRPPVGINVIPAAWPGSSLAPSLARIHIAARIFPRGRGEGEGVGKRVSGIIRARG